MSHGIERLRKLSKGMHNHGVTVWQLTDDAYAERFGVTKHGPTIKNFLSDIADQIEREHAEDCFRMGERAADVSMSAYDLLPADEREAIAWVREHGGLSHVKDICHDLRAVVERLGIEWSESELHGLMDALDRRLMPEGAPWLRFEDGEPVKLGGEVTATVHDEDGDFDRTLVIRSIKYKESCVLLEGTKNEMVALSHGERVKRPAPKVLDADGVEIRVGDDLYGCESGRGPFKVLSVLADSAEVKLMSYLDGSEFTTCAATFTHRAPVLAADGKPLREREKPYRVDNGKQVEIRRIDPSYGESCVFVGVDGMAYGYWLRPDQLTHERPVSDTWERLEEDAKRPTCDYFGHGIEESCETCHAYTDSTPQGGRGCRYAQMADLVRRAKALAGDA